MNGARQYGLMPRERQYVAEVDAGIVRGDVELLVGMVLELQSQVDELKDHLSPPLPQEKVLTLERDRSSE